MTGYGYRGAAKINRGTEARESVTNYSSKGNQE